MPNIYHRAGLCARRRAAGWLLAVPLFLGAAIAVSLARSAHALDDSYTLTLARTQLAVYSPAAVKDSLDDAHREPRRGTFMHAARRTSPADWGN